MSFIAQNAMFILIFQARKFTYFDLVVLAAVAATYNTFRPGLLMAVGATAILVAGALVSALCQRSAGKETPRGD